MAGGMVYEIQVEVQGKRIIMFVDKLILTKPQDASTEPAVNQAGRGRSREHRTGSAEGSVLETIAENLLDVGIEVQALHPGARQRRVIQIHLSSRMMHLRQMAPLCSV